MAKRIERVLTNNPGIGVARHVNARCEEAERFAEKEGREEMISSFLAPSNGSL